MLLKKGNVGINVTFLQYGLHIMCCTPNGFDGSFGTGTENAVIKYQNKMGLSADGVVGDGTWNNLKGEISIIQRALKSKGYYSSYIDGIANEETYNAVVAFQQANSLSADGQVGSETRVKLMRVGSVEVADSNFPLSNGATGDKVIYLQYGLHILCCSPGSVDGVYGAGTIAAVKNFQTKYSFTVDGIATLSLWNKMKSLITEIQQALVSKGYEIGGVDGVAGEATYSQIVAFQNANGLIADGQVGPATRKVLTGEETSEAVDDFPLEMGDRGPYVLFLQYGLHINCISVNGADGVFGAGTKAAVEKFQTKNNMTVTGIVTTEEWEKLRSIIKPIQQALTNRGYDTGGVDGIAGTKTYDAVVAFQQDNGLGADGMVGNATMQVLLGESTGGGTVSSVLRLGSNGSLTKYLQRILQVLGYEVSVDGIFGTSTHNAVVAFQNTYQLTADGIVGGGTWQKLFSVYRVPVSGSGVQKMLNVAQHELNWGFSEDNGNNITPYGEWYGMNSGAWCAMFVSWCAYQAGILGTVVPRFAYCPYGVSDYRNMGKFYSRSGGYVPKVGDTIFFFDAAENAISHTGIVTGVTETHVTTIEGNYQDKVATRKFDRNNTYIFGYGDNGGAHGDEVPEEPSEEEYENILKEKFKDLLSSVGYNLPTYNYTVNRVETIVDLPNLKVEVGIGFTDAIFNNQGLSNPTVSTSFDVSNGTITMENGTNMTSFLQTSVGAEFEQGHMNIITKLAYELGDGSCSMSAALADDGAFSVSLEFEGEIEGTEVFGDTYYFLYKFTVKNNDPTNVAVQENVGAFNLAWATEGVEWRNVATLATIGIVFGGAVTGILAFLQKIQAVMLALMPVV